LALHWRAGWRKKAHGSCPTGDLGRDLRDLLAEIRADKRTLHELCVTAGAKETMLKQAGGWIAEKTGWLKLSFRSERDAADKPRPAGTKRL
jgi:hypothetical protein